VTFPLYDPDNVCIAAFTDFTIVDWLRFFVIVLDSLIISVNRLLLIITWPDQMQRGTKCNAEAARLYDIEHVSVVTKRDR